MNEHKDVNEITFAPESYDNIQKMWDDILSTIRTLMKNEYVVVIHEEDFGIVVLRYTYQSEEIGDPKPYFLSDDEYESVMWDDDPDECEGKDCSECEYRDECDADDMEDDSFGDHFGEDDSTTDTRMYFVKQIINGVIKQSDVPADMYSKVADVFNPYIKCLVSMWDSMDKVDRVTFLRMSGGLKPHDFKLM